MGNFSAGRKINRNMYILLGVGLLMITVINLAWWNYKKVSDISLKLNEYIEKYPTKLEQYLNNKGYFKVTALRLTPDFENEYDPSVIPEKQKFKIIRNINDNLSNFLRYDTIGFKNFSESFNTILHNEKYRKKNAPNKNKIDSRTGILQGYINILGQRIAFSEGLDVFYDERGERIISNKKYNRKKDRSYAVLFFSDLLRYIDYNSESYNPQMIVDMSELIKIF